MVLFCVSYRSKFNSLKLFLKLDRSMGLIPFYTVSNCLVLYPQLLTVDFIAGVCS